MARSAETTRRAQYLIDLGFNISDTLPTRYITQMYRSIEALGESLRNVGEGIDLPVERAVSSLGGPMAQLQGYLDRVSQNLNEMYQDQAMTFRAMRDGTISVTRAFGDLLRAQERINAQGESGYTVSKSRAANALFPNESEQEILDIQNRAYTKELVALGDDTQKALLKLGIQDSLDKVNADTAEFLKKNLEHIEDFVERSRMMYDSDGKAIGSWVKIRLAAGKSLEISQRYFDQTLTEETGGDVTSRIGVRTSQQVTTDRAAALREVERALTNDYNLERQIADARSRGNNVLADQLDSQRQLYDELQRIRNEYIRIYDGVDEHNQVLRADIVSQTPNGEQTERARNEIREIEERIDRQRQFDTAVRDENEQRSITNELATEYQRNQREIFDFQKKMDSAIRSGNETYETSLRSQIDLLQQRNNDILRNPTVRQSPTVQQAITDGINADFERQQQVYQNIIRYTQQIEDLRTRQVKTTGAETAEINQQINALQRKIDIEKRIFDLSQAQEASVGRIGTDAAATRNLESLKKNLSDLESNYKQLLDAKKKAMAAPEDSSQKQYYEQLASTIEQNIKRIKGSINSNNQASVAQRRLNQITNDYAQKLKEIQTIQNTKKDEQSIKNTIEAYKKLLKAQEEYEKLRQRKANISALAESKSIVDELKKKYEALSSSILSNGKAVKKNSEFVKRKNELYKEYQINLRKLKIGLDSNSDSLHTLSQRFKMTIENVIKYKLAQYGLEEALQKSVQTIKELDQAITNIRLVTGETATTVRQTINEYAELAKELGTTTKAVSEGSIEWLCKRSCKISLIAGNSLEINILNYCGNINNGLTNY